MAASLYTQGYNLSLEPQIVRDLPPPHTLALTHTHTTTHTHTHTHAHTHIVSIVVNYPRESDLCGYMFVCVCVYILVSKTSKAMECTWFICDQHNPKFALKDCNNLFFFLPCSDLSALPTRITRSVHLLDFFKPRLSDRSEEYPPLHRITTLHGEPTGHTGGPLYWVTSLQMHCGIT